MEAPTSPLFDLIEQEQKKPFFTFKKIGSEIASADHILKILQSPQVGLQHIFTIENAFNSARITVEDVKDLEVALKQKGKLIKWSVEIGNVETFFEYEIQAFQPPVEKEKKEKGAHCKIRFKRVPVVLDSVEKFNVIFHPFTVVKFTRDNLKKSKKTKTKNCLIVFKSEPDFAKENPRGFFEIKLNTSTLKMPYTKVGSQEVVSAPQIIEKAGDV